MIAYKLVQYLVYYEYSLKHTVQAHKGKNLVLLIQLYKHHQFPDEWNAPAFRYNTTDSDYLT